MDNQKNIELVFYAGASLLEGPRMHPSLNCMLCVSIEQGCVYYINLDNGFVKTYMMKGEVGCAVFENEKTILVAEYTGIYRIHLDTDQVEYITQLLEDSSLRYNDGILDRQGRFLVGTTGYRRLAENQNFLYCWDRNEKKILVQNTTISNGIGFSPEGDYMYFVDTPTKKVARYYYNHENGKIAFDKYVITIKDDSFPDGICTDRKGMLWVAHWGGSRVSQWNPDSGQLIREISLPCKNVSSCCLGGDNEEYLYVTTAKHDDQTTSEILAGGLFRVNIGA